MHLYQDLVLRINVLLLTRHEAVVSVASLTAAFLDFDRRKGGHRFLLVLHSLSHVTGSSNLMSARESNG